MPKAPLTAFRLPRDLLAELDARAAREGVTRSALLVEAVRELLAAREARPLPQPAVAAQLADMAGDVDDSPLEFGCPAFGCSFRSASPAAVCARHGRRVR